MTPFLIGLAILLAGLLLTPRGEAGSLTPVLTLLIAATGLTIVLWSASQL